VHWYSVSSGPGSRLKARSTAVEHGCWCMSGFGCNDQIAEAGKLAEKIASLRIFADEAGKLNLSAQDVRGASWLYLISHWWRRQQGRRPDFTAAAPAEPAEVLYEHFIAEMKKSGCLVAAESSAPRCR